MRAAAIDFGKVRVGIAVSDELGSMAHPRPFLDGRNIKQVLRQLAELQVSENIELFLVGLPRKLDASEGVSARRARKFAKLLQQVVEVPVQMVDEWLSTREAMARLREGGVDARQSRSRVDSAAAAILLQSWLDQQARQA